MPRRDHRWPQRRISPKTTQKRRSKKTDTGTSLRILGEALAGGRYASQEHGLGRVQACRIESHLSEIHTPQCLPIVNSHRRIVTGQVGVAKDFDFDGLTELREFSRHVFGVDDMTLSHLDESCANSCFSHGYFIRA